MSCFPGQDRWVLRSIAAVARSGQEVSKNRGPKFIGPSDADQVFFSYCGRQVNWDASKLLTQKNVYPELGGRMLTPQAFGTT